MKTNRISRRRRTYSSESDFISLSSSNHSGQYDREPSIDHREGGMEWTRPLAAKIRNIHAHKRLIRIHRESVFAGTSPTLQNRVPMLWEFSVYAVPHNSGLNLLFEVKGCKDYAREGGAHNYNFTMRREVFLVVAACIDTLDRSQCRPTRDLEPGLAPQTTRHH
ncbi:hypothetical protein RRG08_048263 [Elysia crispata]|uniref:Uncharacterized protein n=1 Tax=Elysia crispata TaxID=231223 RepID=A0AAE0ZTH9_9GAST|nr:hypothetical protein RRG08_048263 [Elysia crispata]